MECKSCTKGNAGKNDNIFFTKHADCKLCNMERV